MNASNIETVLQQKLVGKVAVVGVGNMLRRDDGAGSCLAQRLKTLLPETTFDGQTAPENFLAPVTRLAPDTLVILDSGDWGASAGAVRILDPSEIAETSASTHALSLRHFARTVSEETGCSVIALAIQVKDTSFGEGLSRPVEESVKEVASVLESLLRK